MCWAKLSLLLSSLPVTPCTAMTLFSSPLLWLTAWLPGQSHVSVASSSQILTQLFHYFLCIAFPLYCLITNSVLHLALTLPLSLLLSHSCFLSFSSHYTLVPYSFCFKLTPACTDLICLHTSTVRSLDLVLSCVSVTWHANRFMEFTHIYVVCLSHCSCLYCSFVSLSLCSLLLPPDQTVERRGQQPREHVGSLGKIRAEAGSALCGRGILARQVASVECFKLVAKQTGFDLPLQRSEQLVTISGVRRERNKQKVYFKGPA